jgi:uncharacterized protein YndB with AHSA1/START domain
MTIAPIIHTVRVKAPPPRAFDLFATRMGEWWPRGKTLGKEPHAALVIEPRAGGRWFERDAGGNETPWGKVLAWEPPSRLLLAWQINTEWRYDANVQSEVELRFASAQGGGTMVTLEHRNFESLGVDAAAFAEKLRGGWPGMVGAYARLADIETAPAV